MVRQESSGLIPGCNHENNGFNKNSLFLQSTSRPYPPILLLSLRKSAQPCRERTTIQTVLRNTYRKNVMSIYITNGSYLYLKCTKPLTTHFDNCWYHVFSINKTTPWTDARVKVVWKACCLRPWFSFQSSSRQELVQSHVKPSVIRRPPSEQRPS